jgi:hypothetical protein
VTGEWSGDWEWNGDREQWIECRIPKVRAEVQLLAVLFGDAVSVENDVE